MTNVEIFDKYLEENKIYMLKGTNVEGFTHYSFPEKITVDGVEKRVLGGGTVRRALIALKNDDNYVDIFCFNITNIPEKVDLYKLYTVLNELNTTYKFITFYEVNDMVSVKSCMPFTKENFDPQQAFQILSIIFKSVEAEYSRIVSTLQ